MSTDAPATEPTDRPLSPEAVTSHISRESSDTYVARHIVDDEAEQYEIRRRITHNEGIVSVRCEWRQGEVQLRVVDDDRPVTECFGESARARSLLGFVCYEHYTPEPTEQFRSLLTACEHDAF